ncbi:PA0069 family radical SAM protein [Endothiovibrio diazotrophicus]
MNRITPSGRGTGANPAGRFAGRWAEPEDDGWSGLDEPSSPLRTTLTEERARTILSHNRSPDVPFSASINPYRGCEHGCIYCYARPTHAYLDLSPGLDFESRLFVKREAPQLLEEALRHPRYRCEPIALGANTDAYQPVERYQRVTRGVVEVMARFRQPFTVVTKSALVERELDLIAPLAAQGVAGVCISLTTLDRALARRLEPRATAPQRRLETIRRLSEAGVAVGVLAAPIIPGLNDQELESLLAAAREAGARFARYQLVRLPFEVEGLFEQWLAEHHPLAAERVMGLVRECHDQRPHDTRFGLRMRGSGAVAELIAQRFRLAWRRLGFVDPPPLRCDRFTVPPRSGDQMGLF